MFMILALFLLVGADLLLKWYVEKYVGESEIRNYLNGKLRLRKFHNPGFILGKGKERQDIVKYGSLIMMILVGLEWLFLLPSKGHRLLKTAMTCIFAGAVSNVSDRFTRGYVVDYLSVKTKWEKINRLVFNIADVLIAIGSILAVLGSSCESAAQAARKAAKQAARAAKKNIH